MGIGELRDRSCGSRSLRSTQSTEHGARLKPSARPSNVPSVRPSISPQTPTQTQRQRTDPWLQSRRIGCPVYRAPRPEERDGGGGGRVARSERRGGGGGRSGVILGRRIRVVPRLTEAVDRQLRRGGGTHRCNKATIKAQAVQLICRGDCPASAKPPPRCCPVADTCACAIDMQQPNRPTVCHCHWPPRHDRRVIITPQIIYPPPSPQLCPPPASPRSVLTVTTAASVGSRAGVWSLYHQFIVGADRGETQGQLSWATFIHHPPPTNPPTHRQSLLVALPPSSSPSPLPHRDAGSARW